MCDEILFTTFLKNKNKNPVSMRVSEGSCSVNCQTRELRTQRLGALQLSRAKQQLKGQIAILEESNLNLMLSLGKSLLLKSRIDTIEDVYARIDAIQADHILEVSNEIFEPSQLSTLVFRCK